MQRSFDTAFKTKEHVMLLAGEVCFGTLLDGAALPTKPLEGCLSQEYSECEGFFTCSVRQIDGYHVLCAVGCSDEFALLDVNSSNRLHVIENIETIRYEAIMDTAMAKKQRRRPNSKCAPISLSINIFGQPSIAMEVGRRLSAASIFLQHPKALFKEIQYRNPQFLAFPEDTTDMRAFVGVTNDSPSARRARISDEISAILDCLSDNSLGMTIEYTQHHGLLSSLKPHQVQGVCFMLQRESVRNPSLVSAETINTRDQHRGGIIADAMGLGKTLTVLTTILQSSYKAALFRDFGQEPMARTKATLVVVSSAQLLESWGSEIERHFSSECLKTIVFHGQNRPHDPKSLSKADIVMTTYGTLVAEEKGRKLLQKLKWFRIVLDEAHWIRNTSSRQFKSTVKLSAQNRWCLTGTPIQNRLEDIAALAGFLQLHPCPTRISFQKNVLDPLSQGGQDFSKPLRSWLQAVCIRRTGKLLQLPDKIEESISISLSLAERKLYDQLLYRTKREIDEVVSKGKSIKKYNFLFTAILKMRMLCNSGTYSNHSSLRYLRDPQVKETGCEQCATSRDEDAALLLAAFQFCPDCGRSLQVSSPGSNLGSSREGNSPLPEFSPTPEKSFTPSDGYSAKLFAVTDRIRTCRSPSKHIVFSYWTSTLDLLSSLLGNGAVTHVQVDGRTSYAERSRRLQSFREDDDTSALLMSIETGALGLNLTAANYVHIVEPQWNPSVEEQAVGRALRIGQTREVTVLRYIVQGTVEQNIMHLQKKKKSVAKFMFNIGAADELDGKLEDLKFVLDLDPTAVQ